MSFHLFRLNKKQQITALKYLNFDTILI